MKLCPQCEFIYEDDQRVCDMDGKKLVNEPTLPAFPGKPAPEQSVLLARARSPRFQRIAVTAAAGLALAATLFLFYYVFAQRVSSARPAVAPTSTSNPILPIPKKSASPAALATPVASRLTPLEGEPASTVSQSTTASSTSTAGRQPHQHALSPTGKPTAVAKPSPSLSVSSLPTVKALPQLKPLPKLEEKNATNKTNQVTTSQMPVSVKQKKDSRVGSFLKKTGRILTKPFKR